MRPAPAAGPAGGLGPELAEELALHCLAWLTAGCLVGVLLAGLLAWPQGNVLLAPLTYGRWVPVHLDLLLYGWTALPLVGLLLRLYLPGPAGVGPGRIVLTAWSGALGAGVLALLAGRSSGKPFLDWTGPVRVLWIAALALLWCVLAFGFGRALVAHRAAFGKPAANARLVTQGALLLLLAAGPWVLDRALDAQSYPPIDPSTGGPTGTDLAASTIAILPLFLALPALVGLARRPEAPRPGLLWALLVAHAAVLPLFGLGDQSHHSSLQIAAIASVLVWPLLLARHLLGHIWPPGSGRWLAALGAWGTLLATSAVVTFLPGVLDAVKFTHALVGHAHLAMAGFATSFAGLTLHALLRDTSARSTFARPLPFLLWQCGTAFHVLAMAFLGYLEAGDPGLLQRSDVRVTALFAVRGAAGTAMLLAALAWLRNASRLSAT